MRNENENEKENENEDTTKSYQVTFLSRPVIQVSPNRYRYSSTRLERTIRYDMVLCTVSVGRRLLLWPAFGYWTVGRTVETFSHTS